MSENYVVENLIGGNNFFEIPEYQRAYSRRGNLVIGQYLIRKPK